MPQRDVFNCVSALKKVKHFSEVCYHFIFIFQARARTVQVINFNLLLAVAPGIARDFVANGHSVLPGHPIVPGHPDAPLLKYFGFSFTSALGIIL
jgi:hypothetical protein